MAKPIVVLMPNKERAALRESGVLPFDFFSIDNPNGVRLWPHDIDYNAGCAMAETIVDRPGDVPAFFGFPKSTSSSEINERTAEIVRVLNSVMVHVVFLDDTNDGGEIEYGHFSSFGDLVEWSRSLLKVLKVRFVNEVDLQGLENVLVVIVRGQQIKITEKELGDFSEIVGVSSRDNVRPFRSCYFLNHELSIDSGLEDIFAENVWDILVARLLKAFVLSREQCLGGGVHPTKAIWMQPGVKIWKCEECEPGGIEAACKGETETALENVDALIKEASRPDRVKDTMEDPVAVGRPGDAVEVATALSQPSHFWYSFDPIAFVDGVANSKERADAVARSAEAYVKWKRRSCAVDASERERIFASVKESPSKIFGWRSLLDKTLSDEAMLCHGGGRFKSLVSELVDVEKRRCDVLSALSSEGGCYETKDGMAQRLKKAQRHYVGFGGGMCIVASIVSVSGWLAWQVMKLLDATPTCVIALTASVAFGAFFAMVALVSLHARVGRRATELFMRTCQDLDALAVMRANLAREILCAAVERRVITMRRNSRMRSKGLLDRIGKTLIHEIHFAPAVASLSETRHQKNMTAFKRKQREVYLAKTHTVVNIPVSFVPTGDVQNMVVDLWWAHDGAHLRKFWSDFSRKFDTNNSGHFPVSVFIPGIRAFMANFVRASRTSFRMLLNEQCFDAKINGVKKWFTQSGETLFYSAKAAINPRAIMRRREVYVAKDEDPRILSELRNCDNTVSAEFFESKILSDFETSGMALSYHEMRVTMERDSVLGVLKLRQTAEEDVPQ